MSQLDNSVPLDFLQKQEQHLLNNSQANNTTFSDPEATKYTSRHIKQNFKGIFQPFQGASDLTIQTNETLPKLILNEE